MSNVDVRISGRYGSTIYRITPLTDTGNGWVEDNVNAEGYMHLGGSTLCEHSYIIPIITGMLEAGLVVQHEETGRLFMLNERGVPEVV